MRGPLIIGLAIGIVIVALVGLQMASDTEAPPTMLAVVDYGLLAFGAGAIGFALVGLIRRRKR